MNRFLVFIKHAAARTAPLVLLIMLSACTAFAPEISETIPPQASQVTAAPTPTPTPAPPPTPVPSPQANAEDVLPKLKVSFAESELPISQYDVTPYGYAPLVGSSDAKGVLRLANAADFTPEFAVPPASWELVYLDGEGHPTEETALAANIVLTVRYSQERLNGEVVYTASIENVGDAQLVLSSAESQQGKLILATVENTVDYADYSIYLPYIEREIPAVMLGEKLSALLPVDITTEAGVHTIELRCKVGETESRVSDAAELTVLETEFARQDLQTSAETQAKYSKEVRAEEEEILGAARALSNPEPYFSGAFDVPLTGRRSTQFGIHRYVQNELQSRHAAYDIAAPANTEVHAPEAGVVVFNGTLAIHGNTVLVDHGMGVVTSYSHLNTALVEMGDYVEKGAVIALVGSTGYSTGPHLHYSVAVSNCYVEPDLTLDTALFGGITAENE